jgi:uncharacterized protein YlxW (UPF0749 family)
MYVSSTERNLAESEAENDQWQKKVAELWAERERHQAEFRDQITEEHAEIQRLRLALRRLQAGLGPDAGYYSLHLHEAREIIEQALGED